jgi:hypothetical protein
VNAEDASKVFFMATTEEVGPGFADQFYVIDTSTKTPTNIPLKNYTQFKPGYSYDYLSGGTICGGTYYGLWSDINTANAGLASIEIDGGNVGQFTSRRISEGFHGAGALYHSIYCDSTATQPRLLTVRSDLDPSGGTALFSVREVSLEGGKKPDLVKDTCLGNFTRPDMLFGGNDATFGFKKGQSGLEVWATYPNDVNGKLAKDKSGYLEVMQVSTGQVSSSDFPRASGYPYMLLVDDGTGKAHVATHKGQNPADCCTHTKLAWNEMEVGGGKVTLKEVTGVDANGALWGHTQPITLCDGLLWSLPRGTPNTVRGSDPVTLKAADSVDISSILTAGAGFDAGGLACI